MQASINQIATRLVQFLEDHAWTIVMPDGSISTTFIPRPDEILTLLQVGQHVNPSAFSTDYTINKILFAAAVLAPITVDAASDSSYFKFNLDYISFYNLIRLESGSSKSVYQAAYQVLRAATSGDQNAMFDLIDRGLNGANASRDAEAAGLLNEWLERPSRDNPVNLNGVVPVCSGQACKPIPVALRPPDEYLWEESPYQLAGGGSGIIETAGVDYILPYWMARSLRCCSPPVEVQSAAVLNAAVTPESIASIYGSNLSGRRRNLANVQPSAADRRGVTLTVTDSAGTVRVAPLMYVSPSQINFVVPSGSAAGPATFATATTTTTAMIQSVAPTLFSMSGDGRGVAAAEAIAVQGNSQTPVAVFQCSATGCVSTPIQLGASQTVYLILYGTGIRSRSSLDNVTVNIGGTNVPVLYAGAQPSFEGLDQVNVALPVSLSGSGEVNIVLTVDGQSGNPVTVNIR